MNTAGPNTVVSCGGVVIYRNKVLLLYKNQNGRHVGWVLPKGNLEPTETTTKAALREVKEESGVSARIVKYLGSTQYSFRSSKVDELGETGELLAKTVHWYLMSTTSYYCKPQAEEFFADAGFYKRHEAEHLLKFHDEKQIMRKAFAEYDNKTTINRKGNVQ
ncbi:MAG: NUDIX domain-containing protein [Firmicutes bacterium]|nr:NUDIX domain-containing protein [Bacillota bacterium]